MQEYIIRSIFRYVSERVKTFDSFYLYVLKVINRWSTLAGAPSYLPVGDTLNENFTSQIFHIP